MTRSNYYYVCGAIVKASNHASLSCPVTRRKAAPKYCILYIMDSSKIKVSANDRNLRIAQHTLLLPLPPCHYDIILNKLLLSTINPPAYVLRGLIIPNLMDQN